MRVTANSIAKNYDKLMKNIVVNPQSKSSDKDSSNITDDHTIIDSADNNMQPNDTQSAHTQSNDTQSMDMSSDNNDLFLASKAEFMQTYYDTISYMRTHYSLKSKKDTKDFWHKFYATNYSAAQYIYNKFYLLADTTNDSKSDNKLDIKLDSNADQVYDMLSVFILPQDKFIKHMIKSINIDAINELIDFLETKIKDNTVICFEAMHKACVWFLKSLLDMKTQYYYLQQVAHTRGILYGLFEKANRHLAISQHMYQQFYNNYYLIP